jgi:hypothetical protein
MHREPETKAYKYLESNPRLWQEYIKHLPNRDLHDGASYLNNWKAYWVPMFKCSDFKKICNSVLANAGYASTTTEVSYQVIKALRYLHYRNLREEYEKDGKSPNSR